MHKQILCKRIQLVSSQGHGSESSKTGVFISTGQVPTEGRDVRQHHKGHQGWLDKLENVHGYQIREKGRGSFFLGVFR